MTAIADRRANGIRTRNRPVTPGAPYISELERAAPGGVATLDETSALVPASQLGSGTPTAAKALLGDRTWGDVATQAEIDAEIAARIADVDAEEAARIAGDALKLAKASNLSDVANVATSRTNLGLGALAVLATVGTAQIDNDAVTYAKIQNVSATDKLLGRSTAGAGDVEEIACTAAARSILDDATIAAMRTTLGVVEVTTGTFTPTIVLTTGSVTYTAQEGTWTRIGNLMICNGRVQVNVATAPTGVLKIDGLPVAMAGNNRGAVSMRPNGFAAAATTAMVGAVIAATTFFTVLKFAAGNLADMGGDVANGCSISFTAIYEV